MDGQAVIAQLIEARWLLVSLALHLAVFAVLAQYDPVQEPAVTAIPIEIVELKFQTPEPPVDIVEAPSALAEPSPVETEPQPAPETPAPVVVAAPPVALPVVSSLPDDVNDRETVVVLPPEPPATPLGTAERRALAGIVCRSLTERQKIEAGCDAGADARSAYAPLFEATPLKDQAYFDERYYGALAKVGAANSYLEKRLTPQGVPQDMFEGIAVAGPIDNTAFLEIRPFGQADYDRVMSGQAPSWEGDVRRAHGRD